ncbi:hypothetical protein Glove_120g207 [Diversispora epigaea]|uniref:Glutathione S-transferase n=1 Tax=Diversispora epigaea TaxID=1348612 RepID=A0A397J9H0_9GLOM|nr:hypothetical protein Glove_120g207 [Diversispora epigaea]
MITLYDYSKSGNCYKIRLLFSLLRIPYNRVEMNIKKGETGTEEFLNNISLNGKLPVLIIPKDYRKRDPNNPNINPNNNDYDDPNKIPEDGITLTESNAILTFISEGTPLFPSSSSFSNSIHNAKIMQWLFWEQFSLVPNILPLRWWITYLNLGDDPKYLDQIVEKQKLGYEALNLMENHLKDKEFFVDDKFTIADIALYANTHICEEAGYSIDSFPIIRAWLRRIEQMPGFIPIDD